MKAFLTILTLLCVPALAWADPATPGANAATAEYNGVTGELKISSAGAVNVFVQSSTSSIIPPNPSPAVPVGLLTSNSSRIGITNLGPINVSNFSFGNIGVGALCRSDLSLHYTPALGQKEIVVAHGAEAFRCVPEPSGFSLIGAGLVGLLTAFRKHR